MRINVILFLTRYISWNPKYIASKVKTAKRMSDNTTLPRKANMAANSPVIAVVMATQGKRFQSLLRVVNAVH